MKLKQVIEFLGVDEDTFGDAIDALTIELKDEYSQAEVSRIKGWLTTPEALPSSAPSVQNSVSAPSGEARHRVSSSQGGGAPADALSQLAQFAATFVPAEAKNDGEKLLHLLRSFYNQTGYELGDEVRKTVKEGREFSIIKALEGAVVGNREASQGIQFEVIEVPKFKRDTPRYVLPSVEALTVLPASE